MNEEVKNYIERYPKEVVDIFIRIRNLILSIDEKIEEKMWAKIPSYYIEESFIRLIPFKDHINIEAVKIIEYQKELEEYKITPKGMLQIFINDKIPLEKLKIIFIETFNK